MSLYVEEEGAGPPILLIQGLGNSSWPARHMAAGLGARRVIWFDNRGTGRSPKEPPESIEQLSDDAASVLEGRSVTRADILGHSMGGYIALTLGLRRPRLVRSLVLVGTGPGAPTHEPVPPSTLDVWLANARLPPQEYARKTMHLSFAPGWKEAHEDEYERLVAERVEFPTPPRAWRAQFDAATRFVEAGLPVEEIEAPTLVVHGDQDRVVPISNGRALAQRIPRAELVVFERSGHYPYLEQPERFALVVREFLG